MPLRLSPTPFALVFIVFGMTAGVGVWVSYDRPAAGAKLILALAAMGVYWAIASLRRRSLWGAAALLGVLGGGYSLLFLLTHDWYRQAADLGFLQRLATGWMHIRPALPWNDPGQNVTAGILAMVLPLYAAFVWHVWPRARRWQRLPAAGLFAFMAAGLLMSSSRGAWLALGAALGGWAAWQGSLWLAHRRGWGFLWKMAAIVILLAVAATTLGLASPGGLAALERALPGEDSAPSRLQIASGAWYLAAETPFTGGGLAAFPGLYSEYIRRIRVFEYGYAHNLYLDVAVEQGVFGAAALVAILGGSLLLALQTVRLAKNEYRLLSRAVLASLVAICLHGLIDNALYGMSSGPWLFAVPGLAVALWATVGEMSHPQQGIIAALRKGLYPLGGAAALGLLFLLLLPGISMPATWYVNLGKIEMARLQLSGFPDQRLSHEQVLAAIGPAEAHFEQALQLDATNPNAHYCLGQIALERNYFSLAIVHLESAWGRLPGHRGIRKSLGYAYLWNRQEDQAAELLSAFPEIPTELDAYASWWETQHRSDLAAAAAQFARRLRGR